MTLQILDREKNKLYSDGNFWELSRKEENDCFYGVSFVSSIKFIEEKLLPFYQDIELILGLSDNGNNSIGQRMQELMDKRVSWVNYVENNLESEFAKRILDGSLRLRFTKDKLIHSKVYLMENKEQNTYQCFTGSMNLTETAVSKNFEQLIWDYGSKNDDLYQLYKQMYDDIKKSSATYLDSKRLKGFLVKDNSKQTQLNVYTDSINMLSNSADTDEKVNFPSDEVKVYLNDTTKEIQNGNLGKKEAVTVNQTIKLFTELGNLRKEKTLKKATSEILNLNQIIEYQENSKKSSKKKSDVDYFPKPALIWNNEFEKLFTAPKVGEGGQVLKQLSKLKDEMNSYRPLPKEMVEQLDKQVKIEHVWSSNAIEGSTLTRYETASIIDTGVTVNKKSVRETLEAINLSEAYEYMMSLVSEKQDLSETIIRDLNRLATLNTAMSPELAGVYRITEA